jgi:hypothetical protein
MQFVKRLFDFYLNSSIHVALAVCCLSWITLVDFNVGVELNFIYFTFFATITGYNFVKYFGLAKFHHRKLASWLKYIQVFSFLSFLGLCYFTLKLETKTLLYLAGLGIVTFLYAIPFLPKKYFLDKNKNLRAISGLKIYVIVFVWAITTVIIPLINEDYTIDSDVIVTVIQRYLFVFVAMLPFEIRDMQFDNIKLSTVPQKIGIRKTKFIGIALLILFFLMEFLKDNTTQGKVNIILIITIVMLGFLIFSNKKRQKYYSSFWVEGVPIAWMVLTLYLT